MKDIHLGFIVHKVDIWIPGHIVFLEALLDDKFLCRVANKGNLCIF